MDNFDALTTAVAQITGPVIDSGFITYSSPVNINDVITGTDETNYYALSAADAGTLFQISLEEGGQTLTGTALTEAVSQITGAALSNQLRTVPR